ncbi:MAG: Omp28 family outer membrane lipoprotein [Bacteroidales bacterium]|nr:Omp28 family outer membrane lipoprotein [Bacteroidales bacterium]
MKRIYNIIGILFILGLFLSSCDKVDEPYAQTIGGGNGGGDDTTDSVQVKRVILLEDYTGHRCVNCPAAAETAHGLKQAYGEQLVVMSVHAGFFAMPIGDMTTDFRTDVGEELDQYFGISAVGNPNGMVNRVEIAGSPILSPNAWGTQVATQVEASPTAYIQIESEYDDASRTVDATVNTMFFEDLDMNLKLCVYVLEDSIQAPQKNSDEEIGPTPVIEDYYHNHVLRGSLNGTWGDVLNPSGSVQADAEIEKSYSGSIDTAWVAGQCSLIAYVYDDETKEILQAAEQKIIE